MTFSIKKLIISCVIVAVALTAWWFARTFASHPIRYRLTLEAMLDGKPVTGSGVVEVVYAKRPQLLPDMQRVGSWVRGQAVMLDLGERGTLFALLKQGSDRRSAPTDIVPYAWWQRGLQGPEDVDRIRQLNGSKELSFEMLPMLVRFGDIGDPASIQNVDANNLAASFGPGVRLSRATIGITGDPLTTGIFRWLPWLDQIVRDNATIDGDTRLVKPGDVPLAGQLFGYFFAQGIGK